MLTTLGGKLHLTRLLQQMNLKERISVVVSTQLNESRMLQSITAIVRPFLVDRILERLRLEPIEALHISEVQGFGRQKDYLDQYNDNEFDLVFLPKVEIRIFVKQNRCNEVIDVLLQTARSGRIGDGKIFVVPVQREIDIQTYEMD